MHRLLVAFIGLCLPMTALAQASTAKNTVLGSPESQERASQWNQDYGKTPHPFATQSWLVQRPFSEVEQTGFVAISGESDFELPALRLSIAQNLPSGVTLVIYVGDASDVAALKSLYSPYLSADRLKFLVVPQEDDSDPIWARDSLPFPVYMQPSRVPKSTFGLVDSIYPQDFTPDPEFAQALALPMTSTQQYFRGGNLLLDLKGNCFAENANEVASLSNAQSFFTNFFGCSTVTLLEQEGGIGDIDERIKFLTGNDVLTDNDTYASTLQAKGYTVHRIPTTGDDMETYMNTLYVNGTIFVPQMGIAADQTALAAYQSLGFKAIGVYTKTLADDGNGNIHCATMNYPPGTFVDSPQGPDFVRFSGR